VKNGKRIVAVVPSRLGSVRVKCKSLRLIAGKPLISYVLESIKSAKSFDAVYVNSDSELIGRVGERYGARFYQRKAELATSKSLIDDYLYDFMCNVPCDILAVVNPTSPFLSAQEMDHAVDTFQKEGYDTMIACEAFRTHCFLNNEPINFSTAGQHPRSQDLPPVMGLNFAISLWNVPAFKKNYEEKGFGVYTGKIGLFPVEGWAAIDIDWEEDFVLAEVIMENMERFRTAAPKYDPVLDELVKKGVETSN
jgi:CMP-N,N'-diacetyllegionaminic acid synthase